MQDELLRIWDETRKTVLFVTHSIERLSTSQTALPSFHADRGKLKRSFRSISQAQNSEEEVSRGQYIKLISYLWKAVEREVKGF